MARKFAVAALLCLALAGAAQAGGWNWHKPERRVKSVAELLSIVKDQGFSILNAAVAAADPSIAEYLSNPRLKATVFFPRDEAFTAFLADKGLTADQVLGNQALLTDVLKLHVVPHSAVKAGDVPRRHALWARTLLKGWTGRISLFRHWRSVYVSSKGNPDRDSKVILADIRVGRSIVHVIDYPLFQGL